MKLLKEYISYFRSVSIEAYENQYVKKDSVLSNTPYCIITVMDTIGNKNIVKTWLRGIYRRTKLMHDVEDSSPRYDPDRMFASVNDGKDFAIIQWGVFGKILRRYKDFLR